MNIRLEWTNWHFSKEERYWFIQFCWFWIGKKLLVKGNKWPTDETVFGYVQINLSILDWLALFCKIKSSKLKNHLWNRTMDSWPRPSILPLEYPVSTNLLSPSRLRWSLKLSASFVKCHILIINLLVLNVKKQL